MTNTAKKPGKNDTTSLIDALQEADIQSVVIQLFKAPQNDQELENLAAVLEKLMLTTEDSPDNPYNGVMDCLAYLIEQYEAKHYAIPASDPRSVLRYLMAEHNLTQSDLPEIGTQATVSNILNGRRKLTAQHIQALSQRFQVSPALFYGKN